MYILIANYEHNHDDGYLPDDFVFNTLADVVERIDSLEAPFVVSHHHETHLRKVSFGKHTHYEIIEVGVYKS